MTPELGVARAFARFLAKWLLRTLAACAALLAVVLLLFGS